MSAFAHLWDLTVSNAELLAAVKAVEQDYCLDLWDYSVSDKDILEAVLLVENAMNMNTDDCADLWFDDMTNSQMIRAVEVVEQQSGPFLALLTLTQVDVGNYYELENTPPAVSDDVSGMQQPEQDAR